MSFREQEFTILFFLSEITKNNYCKKTILNYFNRVIVEEIYVEDYKNIEAYATDKSIVLIDSNLAVHFQKFLLSYFTKKAPIVWISESSNSEKAVELLNNGSINNICYIDQPYSLESSILRELKGSLIKSQIQVLSQQSTLISEAALNTQTAVLTTDADGLALWVNKAHTKLSGYTLDEMIGKKPGSLLQGLETDPDTIAYISHKLKEQVAFSVEILNYHKNGEKVWLKLNITPIFKHGKLDKFIAFQEDITEKRRNVQRLADSLKRLQDAQRIGKMCDWVMDVNTYKISWSGRASEILELQDTSEFDYWKFRSQLSITSQQELQAGLIEMRKSHKEYDLVLDFTSTNGTRKVLRTIGVPVYESDELIEVVGIVQDITLQYEAEALAMKSQQQLIAVTNSMQAGVARIVNKLDGSCEIQFANKGFYDLYEVTEELAKTNFELIYNQTHKDDSVLEINAIYAEVLKTGRAVDQYFRIITPSGKLKWIHLISNASAGSDGDIIHDFIVTDITERIQKDRLLDEISEVSLNGGWELDVLTNKLTWTNVTKQIYEVPEDYEPDITTAINFYKQGESRKRIAEIFNDAITSGISRDGQFEIITAKGNHKWVRAKCAAEFAGDQIVRVYGFFQDITEAVHRENAIIESLNEKKALLGEIHHRVKNNLAVISGLLQLELMKGEEAKYSLEDAVNRIQSIAAVHEILYNTENFSVIYLDNYLEKLTLNIAKTNPSLISEINLVTNIEKVGISINQAVPIGLLLNELITNSLKHAFKEVKNGSIFISISNIDDSTVKMNYSDTGKGFNKMLLENSSSLGIKLIHSLMQQLEADHTIETHTGFNLECAFKVEEALVAS